MLSRVLRSSKKFNDKFFPSPTGGSTVDVRVTVGESKRKSQGGDKVFLEELRMPRRTAVVKNQSRIDPAMKSDELMATSTNEIDSSSSSLERYLEPSQTALDLHPSIYACESEIVTAKHPSDILALVASSQDDALLDTTGLHCVARLVSRKRNLAHEEMMKADDRFVSLMSRIGSKVHLFGPVGQSHVLWSIVKLKLIRETAWTVDLLKSMTVIPQTASSVLFSIADISKTSGALPKDLSQAVTKLADLAVALVSANTLSLPTKELVSVATSLARMKRLEKYIMKSLGDRVIQLGVDSLCIDDLTSLLWAFTSLKVIDSELYAKIQHALESKAPVDCSRRNLVDLVWALAKGRPSNADGSLGELFRFTFAPLIRNHMIDLTTRELCTVLWSFSTAEVVDSDFYNDLAHALIPRVGEMNAHDVSSVLWGLGSVSYSHSDLFRSLRHQALILQNEFTPLQLSRAIYGLGSSGVNVEEFLDVCRKRMHLFYAQNIVEILMGVVAGTPSDKGIVAMDPFLDTLGDQTEKISGRDAVQILRIISSLGYEHAWTRHKPLIESLEKIVRERFNCSGRWIPNGYDVCDMTEAMGKLRLSDPNLIEPVLLHLGTVYKSPSFTPDLFLRFLIAASSFSKDSTARSCLSKLLLLREKGIHVAFAKLTENIISRAAGLSLESATDILELYASVGYADDSVSRLAEMIEERFNAAGKKIDASTSVRIAVSLAQLQLLPDFAFKITQDFSEIECPTKLVDLAWARLALGDDPKLFPAELVERLRLLRDVPMDSIRARQVLLSFPNEAIGGRLSFRSGSKRPKSDRKGISQAIDKYESLICHALSELKVKHRAYSVHKGYRVTAEILGTDKKICVDLLSPTDVISPKPDKWSGEAILKKLHFLSDEWVVLTVTIPQIQKALESGSLKPFIADLISPYNEKGKKRVSFATLPPKPEVEDIVSKFLNHGDI